MAGEFILLIRKRLSFVDIVVCTVDVLQSQNAVSAYLKKCSVGLRVFTYYFEH